MEEKIKVEFIGMEGTDALRDYVVDKVAKHERLMESMTSMTVYLKENVFSRGVKADFSVEINAKLPKSVIHVSEVGEDMYALIDTASDTLFRRVKRYSDKLKQWEGETQWKVLEAEEALNEMDDVIEDDVTDNYENYIPKVVERATMEFMSPMDEAEAIERMELAGSAQYLFKRQDGKWCMVYALPNGTYGVTEQGEDRLEYN